MIISKSSEFVKLRTLDKYLEGHNGFIAGGCFKNLLNNEKPRDIDIWFKNEDDFNQARALFDMSHDELYESGKAVGYNFDGVKVELVNAVYGTMFSIVERFDFTVTKAAYGKNPDESLYGNDPFGQAMAKAVEEEEDQENLFLFHDKFFEHLHMKRLFIEGYPPNPINTFDRAFKYSRYGYELCRNSKIKLLKAIQDTEFDESELFNTLYAGLD